jgi:hypothetical protein
MSAEDQTARWLACAGRVTSLHGTRDKKELAARPQISRFSMQASRNDFAASLARGDRLTTGTQELPYGHRTEMR